MRPDGYHRVKLCEDRPGRPLSRSGRQAIGVAGIEMFPANCFDPQLEVLAITAVAYQAGLSGNDDVCLPCRSVINLGMDYSRGQRTTHTVTRDIGLNSCENEKNNQK